MNFIKNKFILPLLFFLFLNNISAQNFEWVSLYDSSGHSQVIDVDVDSEGNVYSIGGYSGYVDFDPDPIATNFLYCDTSEGDIFISKLDSNGNLLWVIGFGSQHPYGEYGTSIKVDDNGDVIVSGIFYDTVDFDTSSNTYNLTSVGGSDTFICKYDSSGNFIWGKQLKSNLTGLIIGNELFVKNSDVYLIGNFEGSINFDSGIADFTLTSNGQVDAYFCKFGIDGNFIWAKGIGSYSNDAGNSIFVDNYNNIFITGGFWGSVDFDPSPSNLQLSSAGYNDIFIAKYNTDGNIIFAKGLEGSSYGDFGNSIKVNKDGEILLTGDFSGVVDFDPDNTTNLLSSNGGIDIFIAKFTPSCNLIWAKNVGGTLNDFSTSLAFDDYNNALYIIGYFEGTVDFDPSSGDNIITSNGGYDIFVEKFNMDGDYYWAGNIGGDYLYSGGDVGHTILVKNYNLYFGGTFEGTADFDIGPATFNYTNISGSANSFITKYTINTLNSDEIELEKTNYAYPNPFESNIAIELNSPSFVTIYNTLGKIVYSEFSKNSFTIYLPRLSSGVYILNIKNINVEYNYKLIKK